MNTISDENQFDALFARIELAPGERFYRRMKGAAWTPAGVARRRAIGATGLTLLLVVAFLAFTPQGRALAQVVIHFFTRTATDSLPVPTAVPLTWVDITPGAPLPTSTPQALFRECGDFPKCSVEQIRSRVNFPVLELGRIPAGMHFLGATGGPERIYLLYDNGKLTYGVALTEEPWTGSSDMIQQQVGASAVVETVQVGDVTGEYIKGGFSTRLLQAPTFNEVHFSQVWDDKVGLESLHWLKDGIFYSMSAWDDDMDNVLLDKDAFVALAAGLTTEPVSARQTYVPPTATPVPPVTFEGTTYILSVAEARQQAGFDVLEPSKLPDVLSLAGAAYDPEQHIVRTFYIEPPLDPRVTFGVRLSQQPIQDPSACNLCSLVRGDYGDVLTQKNSLVVSPDAVIEEVQISGVTGQYFVGQWNGPAWVPYSSVETLRWQANGMAFELKYFGFMDASGTVPISKADLVAIAESLK